MRSIPKRMMSCGVASNLSEILRHSVSQNEQMLKNKLRDLPQTYATSLFYTDALSKCDPCAFKGMFETSVSKSLDRLRNTSKLSFSDINESIRCKLSRLG